VVTVEAVGDYGGRQVYVTSIIEFRNSKIVKQTDYFANALCGSRMARPMGSADGPRVSAKCAEGP
jgi:hypothetical protein